MTFPLHRRTSITMARYCTLNSLRQHSNCAVEWKKRGLLRPLILSMMTIQDTLAKWLVPPTLYCIFIDIRSLTLYLQDLTKLLGKEVPSDKVDKLIQQADNDGDGRISFEEFLTLFRVENALDTKKNIEVGNSSCDSTTEESTSQVSAT